MRSARKPPEGTPDVLQNHFDGCPDRGPAHFWANDDAQKLAKGLRAALAKIDVKKG